jgi:hypothetical protein
MPTFPNDALQSECLSLVAALYGAVSDAERFAVRRAECQAWLARLSPSDSPLEAFLRRQVRRASEACALAGRVGSAVPSACAVVTIDERGSVIAAGAEAWTLLQSGSAAEDPLRLPRALHAFVEDAALSPSVPKAIRVPLDNGSSELAGVVLGVDQMSHAIGEMRVMTLLLCDVGEQNAGATSSETQPRGEVTEFRHVPRTTAAAPTTLRLVVDLSA